MKYSNEDEVRTMTVSIDHPTGKANFTVVTVGSLELAFSYRTVVGFRDGFEGWILSENLWGPTTGRHLNALPGERISRGDFDAKLNALLARIESP